MLAGARSLAFRTGGCFQQDCGLVVAVEAAEIRPFARKADVRKFTCEDTAHLARRGAVRRHPRPPPAHEIRPGHAPAAVASCQRGLESCSRVGLAPRYCRAIAMRTASSGRDQVIRVLGGLGDRDLHALDATRERVAARAVVRGDRRAGVLADVAAVVGGEDHRRRGRRPCPRRPSCRRRTASPCRPCRGRRRRRRTPCAPDARRRAAALVASTIEVLARRAGCSST